MDEDVRRALRHGQVIDITTTGRHSGTPRRIEIVSHSIDGRIYISGRPSTRTRAWIHNLAADPRLIIHLKGPVRADVPATARIVDDPVERQQIFGWIVSHAWHGMDLDQMIANSPLIEVTPDALAA
jgi:deazaflavin-dependent oxidoreductase (nitroreductase family)